MLIYALWELLLSFQLRIRLSYRNEILTCDLSVLSLVDLAFYYPQTVCRAVLLTLSPVAYLVGTAFAYALLYTLLVRSFTFKPNFLPIQLCCIVNKALQFHKILQYDDSTKIIRNTKQLLLVLPYSLASLRDSEWETMTKIF